MHETGIAVYQQKLEENEVCIEHNLVKISKHKPENKIVLVLVFPLRMLYISQICSVSLLLT